MKSSSKKCKLIRQDFSEPTQADMLLAEIKEQLRGYQWSLVYPGERIPKTLFPKIHALHESFIHKSNDAQGFVKHARAYPFIIRQKMRYRVPNYTKSHRIRMSWKPERATVVKLSPK